MVVAHQGKDAAERRSAGEIGVAQRVAGAVDARPLAIPQGEDAVVTALAAHLSLLRAPDGGGGEVLVEAWFEGDVRFGKRRTGGEQVGIEATERRAAVTRDEACRVEPGPPIDLALGEQNAHHRLRAGDEHAIFGKVVFVGERRAGQVGKMGRNRPQGLRGRCSHRARLDDRVGLAGITRRPRSDKAMAHRAIVPTARLWCLMRMVGPPLPLSRELTPTPIALHRPEMPRSAAVTFYVALYQLVDDARDR